MERYSSDPAVSGESLTSDFIWNLYVESFSGIPGEAIVDPRLLRSCPRQHKPQPLPQLPYSIHTIETMIATELKVGISKCMF